MYTKSFGTRRGAFLAGIAAVCFAAAPAWAGGYVYTPLDVKGADTYGVAINDGGLVVGYSIDNVTFAVQPFSYSSGLLSNFGTPGVLPIALNNAGDVLAQDSAPGGLGNFVHSLSTGMNRRLRLPHSPGAKTVSAINQAGDVVGHSHDLNGVMWPADGGQPTFVAALTNLGTIPTVINDRGTVAGYYVGESDHRTHGFRYRDGVSRTTDVPGSTNTDIHAINNRGDVGGSYDAVSGGDTSLHGFTRFGTTFTLFNFPGARSTTVETILQDRRVFGNYWGDSNNHVFMYDFSSGYHSVDFPGGGDTYFAGANRHAAFTGTWVSPAGVAHAFVAVCPADQVPCTM